MKKAVVTGAGGFIGSHLCHALAQHDREIIGIDIHYPTTPTGRSDLPYRAVEGDFRDQALMRELLDGADVLFHLASAHLQISLPDSEYWSVNVHSVPELLATAKQCGVKRCVHISSVGIYGNVKGPPADEKTPPAPQSIYGQTKLRGEHAALRFGREQNFEVVVLRPAWVYGPQCPRTAKLYRALRSGKFIMIGRGANMRHPIFIDDMVQAMRIAAKRNDAAGEVFIIAGERPITTRELIDGFCREFDLPQPKLKMPLWTGRVLAIGVEATCAVLRREPPMSRRTLEFFQSNNAFATDRARAKLGFTAATSFEEGLRLTRPWLERENVQTSKRPNVQISTGGRT